MVSTLRERLEACFLTAVENYRLETGEPLPINTVIKRVASQMLTFGACMLAQCGEVTLEEALALTEREFHASAASTGVAKAHFHE